MPFTKTVKNLHTCTYEKDHGYYTYVKMGSTFYNNGNKRFMLSDRTQSPQPQDVMMKYTKMVTNMPKELLSLTIVARIVKLQSNIKASSIHQIDHLADQE